MIFLPLQFSISVVLFQKIMPRVFSQEITQFSQDICSQPFQQSFEENNNFIKNRLISSLQQFFRQLARSSEDVGIEFVTQLIEKRKRDLFCAKYQDILSDNKEEYSCLIYFKVKSELAKFPQSTTKDLMKCIHDFYEQVTENFKVSVFQFYSFAVMCTYEKLKPEPIQTRSKINSGSKGESRIGRSVTHMKKLYSVMELGSFYLLQEPKIPDENLLYWMKEHQRERNEKVLKQIVKFSTKMKKKLALSNRLRILTQSEATKMRVAYERPRNSMSQAKKKGYISSNNSSANKEMEMSRIPVRPYVIRKKIRLRL